MTWFCRLLIFFFKISLFVVVCFLNKSLGNISRVSSSLDHDHDRRFVGPDLGQNCLKMLSADDTSKERIYDDISSESGIYIKLNEHQTHVFAC